MDAAVANLLSRLESVTARLESVEKQLATGGAPASSRGSSSSSSSSGEVDSAFVQAYEALVNQYITPFVEHSGKIDPLVAEQAALVLKAVHAQRDLLRVASQSKKPSNEAQQKLAQQTRDIVAQIDALKEKNRASKFFNHLAAVSEGIPALDWVLVTPTPGPYVAETRGASEFYSNRILKDYKGKEQLHVDWVSAYNGFLKELQAYIKAHHTTGLSWNPQGGDASSASTSAPAATTKPSTPAHTETHAASSTSSSTSQARPSGDLFSSLSKGLDVTKGLKKVTDDQKTKNRSESERVSVVKAADPKPEKTTGGKAAAVQKPPKFALEGSKWAVEWQNGNRDIVISDTEAKQTLYVYKCNNTTIQVKGKINAITLDNCSRTSVVFESLVASADVVNCNSVELQVTGKVPSITIDKTSGCQVYVGKEALDTQIFTSKCDSTNVLIPGATEQDDLVEIAVSEQFKTTISNGKLITEPNTHV